MKIPLNKLYFTGQEMDYMRDCLERNHIDGDGYYTRLVQDFMRDKFAVQEVFLTASGTSALEMAALLAGLGEGDEVIMPSFTFVSTANAVMLRGARPVFAEIDAATFNLDPNDIEARITSHTKAIIPVHYGGTACDMENLMDIARKHNLLVIEDAAQGVNAAYNGRFLGTIGHMGCYSFHGTKNYTCGEGGALLLNNADQELLQKAYCVWNKGTNRREFLLGQVDKYTWREAGSSYAPADLLAAYLYAQLQDLDKISSLRGEVYKYYAENLMVYQEQGIIQMPVTAPVWKPNYHIFYITFNNAKDRGLVMKHLRADGIEASFHYIPLHSSPMGRKLGYKASDLPVTEEMAGRILRLPVYPAMSRDEQDTVLDSLRKALAGIDG